MKYVVHHQIAKLNTGYQNVVDHNKRLKGNEITYFFHLTQKIFEKEYSKDWITFLHSLCSSSADSFVISPTFN